MGALARREALLSQASSIQKQIDAQANNIDKLYEGMQVLQDKIQEAAQKRNQLGARAQTAKSTQKINDMLSGLTGKTSMDAFNRMEDKVLALEAAAEVLPRWRKILFPRHFFLRRKRTRKMLQILRSSSGCWRHPVASTRSWKNSRPTSCQDNHPSISPSQPFDEITCKKQKSDRDRQSISNSSIAGAQGSSI